MIIWGQQEKNLLVSKNTFSSREGYLISNPYHSIYDSNDLLWVLGENKFSSEYVIGEKEIIIQRFDGANFFTLKLPKTSGKKIKEGYFFKYKNEGLYLKLHYNKGRSELLFIDTETLAINFVEEFNKLPKKYLISKEYYRDNITRLIVTSKNKVYSTELNRLSFKFIDSIVLNKPILNPFLADIISTDEFSIVKLLFEDDGVFIDKKGIITKKINKTDFVNLNGNLLFPKKIHEKIKLNNQFYFYIDDYKSVFKYDNNSKKFIETNSNRIDFEKVKEIQFGEDFKYGKQTEKKGDNSSLKLYSFNDLQAELLVELKIKNFSKLAFKKINKDLIVLNGNTLDSYYFTKSKIKTFLKGKSVRTINRIKGSKYIAATDSEGVYIVDVDTAEEKKINFLFNNKEIPINYSRDIYIGSNNSIIINNSTSLYVFDSSFNLIKERSSVLSGEEIIKVGDTIFSGSNRGEISKYNFNTKENILIKNTSNIAVKEFTSDGEKIFATTSKGILEYEKGAFKVYEFENVKTENLLSIAYQKEFGVLVSTKYGRIYKYDTVNKKLNLFYKDELGASIVGMVADSDKNLWLNTYAGIVSINTSTKKVVRFIKKDGVYELEGNRFSSFRDSDGNILLGSYKGFSFFNPKDLIENDIEVVPKFTSISFFDVKEDRWKIHASPSFLNDVKEIKLPSLYQRFSATMSVFGEMNPKDVRFKYRLLDEDGKGDWYTSYSGKEILFANLAVGEYMLQVEAFGSSKKKIGKTLKLKVISEKVFYKSLWFIIVVFLTILSILIYVFYQYKVKQKLFAKNEIALNEAKIKSAMMLEIHHRIKNNLQIVSGLLGLQMVYSTNEELNLKLQDSQSRIESIAGIHNVLYNSDNQNVISIKNNVENIITYYKALFPVKIIYNLNIDDSVLGMDEATPLSLLLNELISNSNKHAFSEVENPEIFINFKNIGKKYVFEYFDNGNFIKEDKEKKTMGMRIINMMSSQLKGDVKIEGSNGFKLTLEF